MTAIEKFLGEVRADQRLAAAADPLAAALSALDLEGDGNTHAMALYGALEWIAEQPRPLVERLDVMRRLSEIEGHVRVGLRQFAGW